MTPQRENEELQFAKTAVSLLKEYSAKLDRYRDEAQLLVERSKDSRIPRQLIHQDFFIIKHSCENLSRALEHLARQISQRIEHGQLGDTERLELQIRLADFENNLLRTQEFFNLAVSKF